MNFFKSRGFLVTATALVVGGGVYLLMAPKAPSPPLPPVTPENCITMGRDQMVNGWLDANWHSPGTAGYIPSIMFEPSIVGSSIQVEAYPVDANCNPITAKKITMTIQTSPTTPCSFPTNLTLSKTRYDFTNADVDPFGDLVYFNFMRLIPEADPTDPTKLGFKVEFVKVRGGIESQSVRGDTKPCPPFCPVAR